MSTPLWVLSVTPGNFETPMGELEKEEAQSYLKFNAIKRLGQPDEIAALYEAMCSTASARPRPAA